MTIQCPKCKAENPNTSSYCADCGTQLIILKDIPAHTKTLETPFSQFTPETSLADRYKIIHELGKGGMGEVYLAEDTNLKRQVAIKVLPKPFALDSERIARFEREARLLASLNHPNIATIYGLEKSDDQQFLVMELVEGETLADRIKKGPLPLEEALEVCKQIAEGLESAHEKGIIHRDLKPSNVKNTPEGKVKILDFGLAKAFHDEPTAAAPDLSKSPTLTDRMTRPGAILGTAAYMSPEQARSQSVDKRTDIWAFGCVLYECLTGKPALQGETVSDTIALILKGEPDWSKLPSNIPSVLESLLRRCLKKDPRMRLHDIADARIEIEEGIRRLDVSDLEEAPIGMIRSIRDRAVTWIIYSFAIGIVVGIVLSLMFLSNTQPQSKDTIVSYIKIKPGERLSGGYIEAEDSFAYSRPSRVAVALSPDSKNLVYTVVLDNETQLFLHRWNHSQAKPLPGTQGGYGPFFSPDGRWLAFWQGQKLKKLRLEGGPPINILEERPEGQEYGASWGDNDRIVFSAGNLIWQVPATGGSPEQLTNLNVEDREVSHRHPSVLPGGKAILFTVMFSDFRIDTAQVVKQSLEDGERNVLLENAADARFLPTGHLVFARQGSLMAVQFDIKRLMPIGQPRTVIDDVMQAMMASHHTTVTGIAQFSFSDKGELVYIPGGLGTYTERGLIKVDRSGNEKLITVFNLGAMNPRLSLDNSKITFNGTWSSEPGGGECIYVYDIPRDDLIKVTPKGQFSAAIWEPDGKHITFFQREGENSGFYRQHWDGSQPMEKFLDIRDATPGSWSADGEYLLYTARASSESYDIWIYKSSDGSTERIIHSEFDERHPVFSPDNSLIAYTSNVGGATNVYVMTFPDFDGPFKVSTNEGTNPAWSPNGEELFYAASMTGTGTWDLCTVQVTALARINISKPVKLFNLPYERVSLTSPVGNFDIFRDDFRFLMIRRGSQRDESVKEIVFVQNWFEELKRLVPTGR